MKYFIVGRKIIHPKYHPNGFENDLPMLVCYANFDFMIHSPNRTIALHNEEVAQNIPGIISGWGSNHMTVK